MKKILFFILFGLPPLLYSQSSVYHPFPDSNAVWTGHYDGGLSGCGESYSYLINGDTIIGSFSYHKLYIPYVNTWGFCSVIHSAGYNGCIRQDIGQKKVYYIAKDSLNEILLYNFNLQVGDTIYGFSRLNCSQPNDTITQVDSVLIGTDYRKRWHFGAFSAQYAILEGIGFYSGLLEGCGISFPDIPFFNLTCFRQNGQTLYPDTSTPCSIILKVENDYPGKFSASIFPNPMHSFAYLKVNSNFENCELTIYDAVGKIVERRTLMESQTIIHREYLVKGMYFYRLKYNRGEIVNGKFILD